MIVEIKAPSPGESINEVEIASWNVKDGEYVVKDQEIGEIESEKATLAIIAEESGSIKIVKNAGDSAAVGELICTIDTSAQSSVKPEKQTEKTETQKTDSAPQNEDRKTSPEIKSTGYDNVKITPVAANIMEENELCVDDIISGLKRIGKQEVESVIKGSSRKPANKRLANDPVRTAKANKLSSLRKKLSERLVKVKNETAMLTTFNEVDMTAVGILRKKYQKQFVEKHGIKLGYMSFFTKAVTTALASYPTINSMLDGDQIITPDYVDVGIAVQTEKGLMVPVLRNAEVMTLAEIELKIEELAGKARKNRISLDEMSGGTFTISNGGIFGSLLSTPILNPPQSGILGMHNIVDRPVAIDGNVVIRPMMYIALSYDHRIIDGRDSVGFLVKVKEMLESPVQLLFEGINAEKELLGLL